MKRTLPWISAALLFAVACDNEDDVAPEDRDAELDHSDEPPPKPVRGGDKITALDKDGDGAISRAEAEGHRIAAKFDKLDGDGDGKITAEEMRAAWGHHKKGGRWGGGKRDLPARVAKMIEKLDSDDDGTVSEAEAEGHRIADEFADVDTDKDGKLTSAEVLAFKKSRRRGKDHGAAALKGE